MHQLPLPHPTPTPGPVVCLGQTFASDDARRAHFTELLRARLQDPAFRAIEGFPLGTDEAILALSDPPYYTACPNPWLGEMVAEWQNTRYEIRDTSEEGSSETRISYLESRNYHREPFAADVSEGKNDPIYNAHSYHTKVPHKAIMRYILHYTEPGDVVFDGFCGTGMTGVAAQLCGDRRAVAELGYRVADDGTIYDGDRAISRLGARRAVLNDLSPAATFIAYNYNTPVDVAAFEREARRILDEVEVELGWMYETWHPHCDDPGRVKGRINYTVWSEVFTCPVCNRDISFIDNALDMESMRVRDTFPCPHCGVELGKRTLERQLTTNFDSLLGITTSSLRLAPSLIEYKVGREKYTKVPDTFDLDVLEKINQTASPETIPHVPLPIEQMYHGSRLAPKGVRYVHQLFLDRPAQALALLWNKANKLTDRRLRSFILFTMEQTIWGLSLLNRYQPIQFGRAGGSQVNRYLSGVYYISSLISEVSPWYILDGKTRRMMKAFSAFPARTGATAMTTSSASAPPAAENSIDYIFTDPPFGENIYYADLNFLVESWHGVLTDSQPEAIIDQAKRKTMADYQELMRQAFRSYYRWLKPGRWMTVEFHNSHNAVWMAIQEALLSTGFVVADVRTLDKQQKSYRQVTASSAAKQDLVISAYKPNGGFEERFQLEAGTTDGAWDFTRQHLGHLPVAVEAEGGLEQIAERMDYLLFDRMVAFHVQRGAAVPLSAAEFYAGLRQRFDQRDGMFFLKEQAPAYDAARLRAGQPAQLALFVSDEKSSRQWLRQQLDPALGGRPQTYQEIQPAFLRNLHQAAHEQLPELRDLLEDSFLQDETGRWYAPDPNKAEDLERLRRRALLAEFAGYHSGRGKIKQFRSEAVRAGFADAYGRKEYATILRVAERLPERVVQEDPDLLMYYDAAGLRA